MVNLIAKGNLVEDTEKVITKSSGKTMCKFRIMANMVVGNENVAGCIYCASYQDASFKKGDFVEISGRFGMLSWTDKSGLKVTCAPQVVVFEGVKSHYVRKIEKRVDGNVSAAGDAVHNGEDPEDGVYVPF